MTRHPAPAASLLTKMLRFAVVGVVVTGSYALTTFAGIEWAGWHPALAGFAACAVAIVVSYLGQKYFTFRSDEEHRIELPKFLAACMLAVVVSTASLTTITELGLDYRLGILISALLLPLCNFTVMNLWVFGQSQAGRKSADA